jgi:hypothetical protein
MAEETNPFIGPRAFKFGELLYGRDDETQRLFDLLLAERIVLLYAPSGAGKTSLIQARIVPKLRDEEFTVFRSIRVNAKPPHLDVLPQGDNRYAFATKYSIDQELPDPWPVEKLAAMDLAQYFEARFSSPSAPISLLFDQFEEVLTLDPTDDDVKGEFFTQLGVTLRNRRIWALFAMREEFIAALDAFSGRLPTRLQTRFRLNLLDRANAAEAIRQPARAAGVNFSAADKLALDLSSTRVQRGGKTEEIPGNWVEPVQLQVVCRSLWTKPRKTPGEIGDEDLSGVTDVNTALSEYYEERVAAIVKDGLATERQVRDWFTQNLITERGIRAQVLSDESSSAGLGIKAVERLRDDHLIRAEDRRGAVWYELAHDRLVEPIRASNLRWSQENLTTFQSAAVRYRSSGNPEDLLRDVKLATARLWVDLHPQETTAAERQYLAECIASLNTFERAVVEWEMSGRDPGRLLSGPALSEAEISAEKKGTLTPSEESLLRLSLNERKYEELVQEREQQRRKWTQWITAGALICSAVLLVLLIKNVKTSRALSEETEKLNKEKLTTVALALEDRRAASSQEIVRRFEAQTRLAEIAEVTPPQHSKVIVEYFAKPSDSQKLADVLNKHGFAVKQKPLLNPNPTNCIWYGSEVTENDIKIVALALIQAGVSLQAIQPISRPFTMQIGHNPKIEDLPPITADAIGDKPLADLKRKEARTRDNNEGVVLDFNTETHRGTIETPGESEPVFFETRPEVPPLKPGDRITFVLYLGPNRHYAQGVKLIEQKP